MKKNKLIFALLAGCVMLLMQYNAVLAAPASDEKYSVDAAEIEYDMASGDGTASGRTTIQYGDGTAVAEGGATFNSKERTGHLFGGVTAHKEDNSLRSQELVLYTPDFISAVGDAVLTKGDKTLRAPRVDFHNDSKFAETLGGSARLSSADGSWLTAGKIVYDVRTGRVNATGGVNMANSGKKMTGSGDRAVYDSHETGYIELIGNAKLTQDGNTVTGNKLRVTNLSGSDSRMYANGNVCIVYYPQPAADKNAPGNEIILARENGEGTVQKATSHTEDKRA